MKAINEETDNLPPILEKGLQSVSASRTKEKLAKMSTENAILLDDFLKDCRLRKFSTADNYRRIARRFMEYLEKQNLDILKVDRKVLKKYLSYLSDERGLKYGSLQSAFAGLSALFDYLVEEEETIPTNPVPSFRKRYLREYKDEGPAKRKFISVQEASKLVNSTLDTRDRCILLLLLKTGMRRKELSTLDVGDVDLPGLTIVLKPTPKRSNRVIYFDYECADTLRRWLASRSLRKGANGPALFLNYQGTRLSDGGIANVVMKHATRCGLHDPTSRDLAKRVGPHCGRVCFSTWLDRAGMKREFIQELRGDSHREAIDIYLRIDREELKESYLALIPQLGV